MVPLCWAPCSPYGPHLGTGLVSRKISSLPICVWCRRLESPDTKYIYSIVCSRPNTENLWIQLGPSLPNSTWPGSSRAYWAGLSWLIIGYYSGWFELGWAWVDLMSNLSRLSYSSNSWEQDQVKFFTFAHWLGVFETWSFQAKSLNWVKKKKLTFSKPRVTTTYTRIEEGKETHTNRNTSIFCFFSYY